MQRRDFIKISSMGAVLAPVLAHAKTDANCSQAGGVYYTKESPGRWKEKVAGHLPSINIEKKGSKVTVNVVTAHEMKGFEHYIVKHVLLDKNYQFIEEHFFNPDKDKTAVSSFVVDNYSGTIHVLSMCNKHDVWLNSTTI